MLLLGLVETGVWLPELMLSSWERDWLPLSNLLFFRGLLALLLKLALFTSAPFQLEALPMLLMEDVLPTRPDPQQLSPPTLSLSLAPWGAIPDPPLCLPLA